MTIFSHPSRHDLQRAFDDVWTFCERVHGRALEADEIEEIAESLFDE